MPKTVSLTIHLDAKPALSALKEFKSLLPHLLNRADNRLLGLFNLFVERNLPGFINVDAKPIRTKRAGHATYMVKPSNSFLGFLAALRASDVDFNVIRRRLRYHLNKSSKKGT